MKKILSLFILIASVFSFTIAYQQANEEDINRINNIEENIGRSFNIPKNLAIPDQVYPVLRKAADKYGVNIFRKTVHYRADNRVEFLKFIYLTGNTRFFSVFRIRNGRFLTPEDSSHKSLFLSTEKSDDPNQVGVIKDFGSDDLVIVRPLKNSYEQFPVDGVYFAETSDQKSFDAFIYSMVAEFNENLKPKIPYSYEDFVANPTNGGLICIQ